VERSFQYHSIIQKAHHLLIAMISSFVQTTKEAK